MKNDKPKITIGMATYDDFEGVWSTVQSVFLHNDWESPDDVQIVIVDTSPVGSDHRRLVKDYVGKGGHESRGSRTRNIKLIDMAGHPGTTAPRDAVFDHADADVVCVMDCHVMLRSNSLLKLSKWFDDNRDCKDLIHGPILYDNLHILNTHFDDQFRGGMWGTWGSAWRAPDGTMFVCHGEEITDENRERKSDGGVHYYRLSDLTEITATETGIELPFIPWSGHDRELVTRGFEEAGRADDSEPFEIPGQGMGLFACRKDAWLGFAKNCSGFGGEEMNIHTKYRQAGHKVICLPWLKWNHRFGRAGGAPYPIPIAAKIRNYVLWANELGIPLNRVKTHFVDSGQFPIASWKALIADPLNYPINLQPKERKAGNMPAVDFLFQRIATNSPDLKVYAERVRDLCRQAKSVTAFVKRADWEPCIVAGFPDKIQVYQSHESQLVDETHAAVKQQDAKDSRKISIYQTERHNGETDPRVVEPIDPTDVLIIDKENDAEYLKAVLDRHGSRVNRVIAIRGTGTFGEHAENLPGRPGLFKAVREFIEDNPEWFVLQHWKEHYGMTYLAKDPMPRPADPIVPWPIGYGPGTELKAILSRLGIEPSATCSCRARMLQMDVWGVEGCEENFDTIVGWIRENAEKWGWTQPVHAAAEEQGEPVKKMPLTEKLAIGWKSLTSGIAFRINWLDPYPDLVRESIDRAAKKELAQNPKTPS